MDKAPYYSPELSRENKDFNSSDYCEIISIFNDKKLHEEIQSGNITLAMIRPSVGPNANNLRLSDIDAAEVIEGMIEGLGVITKFSFYFTEAATREFYGGGPESSMLKEQPIDPGKYSSRWPEFVDFMTSGPTTALLLHSPNGDAIAQWRSHLGHWNIDEVRDESTIRGKLGVNKYNNLVHGSDAPESVINELTIIHKCMTE